MRNSKLPIEEKKGEISEIPRLIDRIDVRDNTVTIDAIGTHTAIMEKLNQLGAVFLLQVKKNQPQMYEDIISFFEKLDDEETKIENNSSYKSPMKEYLNATDRSKVEEKNRERYEQREYISCQDFLGKLCFSSFYKDLCQCIRNGLCCTCTQDQLSEEVRC